MGRVPEGNGIVREREGDGGGGSVEVKGDGSELVRVREWKAQRGTVHCNASHKSGTQRLLHEYKQAEGWNVLALSNGRWKLPDDRFRAFREQYVSDMPRNKLGLAVKKSEYFPYIMDVDKNATKGASVGSPMEVFQVVVRALESVIRETRMLFEHRNCANFHVLCPDIILDSRTALRIREKQLVILASEHHEVDLNDIVDERVLTSNGLRLLGCLKYREVPGEGQDQELQCRRRLLPAMPDRPGEWWQAHDIQGAERTPAAHTGVERGRPVRAALRGLQCDVHM